MRYASIDIGTNTVLMSIIDSNGNNDIQIVHEEYAIARLGEGTDKTKIINDGAVKRTMDILVGYLQICNKYSVDSIITVTTSAMRDALNRDDVKKKLESVLKSPILVIDGDTEAKLSFIGTVNSQVNALVIDIGGGSTELTIGRGKDLLFTKSLNMGAVRISERFFYNSHPPSNEQIESAKYFIKDKISVIKKLMPIYDTVYAVAGTATTIATSYCGLKDNQIREIDNFLLTRKALSDIYQDYLNSTVDDIIINHGVSPGRAKLIFAGTLILKTIFDHLDIQSCVISARGLRYGAFQGRIDGII